MRPSYIIHYIYIYIHIYSFPFNCHSVVLLLYVCDFYSLHGAKFRYSHPAIYIGSFVTITCLTIMSVTYIISYTSITMPKKAKHSVINTWFAMALLSFLYSIGIQQTEHIEICQGVGLTLHYLSLCCLLWMAVSAR